MSGLFRPALTRRSRPACTALSLLVVGAFVFRTVVSDSEHSAIARIIRWGSLVGIVVSLLQVPLFAAVTSA